MYRSLFHKRWLIVAVLFFTSLFVARVPLKAELWLISAVAIFLFATPVFVAAWQWLGRLRGSVLLTALGLYAFIFETIAIKTGFPYGNFVYNDLLGPKLLDAAPVTVLLAWTPLILGVIYLVQHISDIYARAVLATILLVVTDIVLDPAAVHVGFWFWDTPGFYYGVPLVNFLGWVVSGSIGISGVLMAQHYFKFPALPPLFALNLSFIIAFWASVNLWAGQYVPAVIGLIVLIYIAKKLPTEAVSKL